MSRQVLLEIADVFETLFPNLFAYEFWRQFLFCQEFGMHPDDEHFFIITAVKNSDLTPVRQAFHAAPEVIVIQIIGRGRFERIHLAALRSEERRVGKECRYRGRRYEDRKKIR